MTIQPAEPTMILGIPLSVYAVPTGYEARALYVHARKTKAGTWNELMLEAQNSGCRLPTSAEWYQARSALENTEAEKDFLEGPPEWTGTVLDYDKGELLEGIALNSDGTIATVNTRLGREQGIVLPTESGFVRDDPDEECKSTIRSARVLGEEYAPLVCYLWGVQDIGELPVYTHLYVQPRGFRHVVRGDWSWPRHDGRRVDADAEYGGADRSFAARFVSETRPETAMTLAEYEAMMGQLSERTVLVEL